MEHGLLAALAVELGLAPLRVAAVHLDQDVDESQRGPGGLGYLWVSVADLGASYVLPCTESLTLARPRMVWLLKASLKLK